MKHHTPKPRRFNTIYREQCYVLTIKTGNYEWVIPVTETRDVHAYMREHYPHVWYEDVRVQMAYIAWIHHPTPLGDKGWRIGSTNRAEVERQVQNNREEYAARRIAVSA